MIPEPIKQSLMKNWGDKAEAMDCFAEIKFTDDDHKWNYYIYALNPDDETEAMMIVDTVYNPFEPFTVITSIRNTLWNSDGIDTEFRRIRADKLFKKLKGET